MYVIFIPGVIHFYREYKKKQEEAAAKEGETNKTNDKSDKIGAYFKEIILAIVTPFAIYVIFNWNVFFILAFASRLGAKVLTKYEDKPMFLAVIAGVLFLAGIYIGILSGPDEDEETKKNDDSESGSESSNSGDENEE